MAGKLGEQFLNIAQGPVSYAGRCIMARQVDAGLAELTVDNLLGAVERGVATVAKAVGVPPGEVSRLLPFEELRTLVERIESNQRAAAEQWQVHTGHVGGLLAGVADLTVDGRPPDIGLCLLRLSKKMKRDKPLAVPLHALSEDLDRWQLMLTHCRDAVDNGRELVEAYRRRRLVRAVAAATVLIVLSVVLAWAYSRQLARGRVDAKLDASDPCTVDAIDADDLARAGGEQLARVEEKKEQCELLRDQQRQAEEARRKEAERRAAAEKKRREHEAQCESLAQHIEEGTLGGTDEALSEGAAALLRRVARGKLTKADVGAALPALPCDGTPAGDRIALAMAQVVVDQGPYWLTLTSPSKSVAKLLADQWTKLSAERQKLFDGHVEEVARRAVRSGDGEEMDRCLQLCRIKEQAKVALGGNCQAALSLVQD